MEWIAQHWTDIAFAVTTLISIAAHAAAWTPSTKDDEAVGVFRKLWDFIAGNYGFAKNQK